MQLWSEYEGRTIAGAYNLKKLLRSEGRNAFFATSDKQEAGAVIRLTEAHFDEDEMLKRWRHVAAVDQHYLLAIREVGQTSVDDVAVAYALLEPSDADLADVLRERPLTAAEALQVAKSVGSALSILHTNGLVHEHVQTSNVLAVGETVKLRSDCVRECVADQEFTTAAQCDALRLRDIHDLGVVLLQCLTLDRVWKQGLSLPSPFAQLIPGALDGSWSLQRIASVVETAEAAGAAKTAPAMAHSAVQGNSGPLRSPAVTEPQTRLVPAGVIPAKADRPVQRDAFSQAGAPALQGVRRIADPVEQPRTGAKWMLSLGGLLLLLLLGWYFAAHRAPRSATAVPAPGGSPVAAPPAPVVSKQPASPVGATGVTKGWYVVAYTYNHREQAEAKAELLRRKRGSLQPQVVSPPRQNLFLVTLGGPMSRDQAANVLRQARRSGLPRDTFMRNY